MEAYLLSLGDRVLSGVVTGVVVAGVIWALQRYERRWVEKLTHHQTQQLTEAAQQITDAQTKKLTAGRPPPRR